MKSLSDNIQNKDIEKPAVYVAPTIEVIEVEVECGFAGSGSEDPTVDQENPNW